MKSPQRCVKCILPEHLPGIEFDEKGVCIFCNDYEQNWAKIDLVQKKIELDALVAQARKMTDAYDVLIPLSGGKDSTYVLYYMVKQLGLKALAVHFDNRVETQVAHSNMIKAIDILDVELLCITPPEKLMTLLRREFLLATGECCTPCSMGTDTSILRIAHAFNIPLIASGVSPIHDGYAFSKNFYQYSPEYFTQFIEKAGIADQVKDTIFDARFNTISVFAPPKTTEELLEDMKQNKMTTIYLPIYIQWNENEIINTIERELEWSPDPVIGREHTDCRLTPLKYCLKREKTRTNQFAGIDDLQMKLAVKVRTGQITRDKALSALSELEDNPIDDYISLLKEMGLDETHLSIIKKASQAKHS
ncbi:N-acetyl sugar amidotransferase [Candidatus Magnetomorum sp. HK-1]|nr:N-acetyl sugar amidotransferase [Candidatus Magnetomorum sp. HK-1]